MNFKIMYNDGIQTKTVVLASTSMKKVKKLFHGIYPEYFIIRRVDKELLSNA